MLEVDVMKKFQIFINGHYWTSFARLVDAQACVRANERQDRYERDIEGYTNPLPVYEIRQRAAS